MDDRVRGGGIGGGKKDASNELKNWARSYESSGVTELYEKKKKVGAGLGKWALIERGLRSSLIQFDEESHCGGNYKEKKDQHNKET